MTTLPSTLSTVVSKPSLKEPTIPPNGRQAEVIVYLYDPRSLELKLQSTEKRTVIMETKPFGCGGVSEAFRIWFLQDNEVAGPLQVAKRYKFKMGFSEDHVVSQMGKNLATGFNEAVAKSAKGYPKVDFLLWNTIIELDNDFYSIEDFLPGKFIKYNNIFGAAEKVPVTHEETIQCQLAAAYTHYTWIASGFRHIILDVQGVGNTYTDIAVVSRKMGQYGYTDTGPDNIQNFFIDHKCNDLCRALDLPVQDGYKDLQPPKGGDNGKEGKEAAGKKAGKEGKEEMEWVYRDANGTAHKYDFETAHAIQLAEEKGEFKVKVFVGQMAHHIIDLRAKVHFNVNNGDVFPLESRPVAVARQQLLQVELDDKEWHSYTSEFQAEVLAAARSGKPKVKLSMCGRDYEFDFVALTQQNMESRKLRRIRLVEVEG